MPAATITDVEDLLGRSLTASADRVGRLITRAEGIIAGDMPGLAFEAGTEDVTLEADGDEYIVLPRYPVTAIHSVTVAGTALAAGDYKFDTLGRVRRQVATIDVVAGDGTRGRWPDAGTVIVVSYDYGFGATSVDPNITAVAAELVAARMVNPEQVTQESMGDRSHSFASAAGAGDNLTDGQRHRLRHWRRNRFASARVRS